MWLACFSVNAIIWRNIKQPPLLCRSLLAPLPLPHHSSLMYAFFFRMNHRRGNLDRANGLDFAYLDILFLCNFFQVFLRLLYSNVCKLVLCEHFHMAVLFHLLTIHLKILIFRHDVTSMLWANAERMCSKERVEHWSLISTGGWKGSLNNRSIVFLTRIYTVTWCSLKTRKQHIENDQNQ